MLLEFGHLEDGVDRLLLGAVDECARVHDEHVRTLGVRRDFVARLLGQSEHDLGVDEILRATE